MGWQIKLQKLDKSKYTKEEYKKLKRQRKQSKIASAGYNIVCVKHGSKYPAQYVNTLYNMCKRHCTYDFTFVCLTDDPTNLNPNITTVELPPGIQGWWAKPYMFSNELGLVGQILYMDLDVVVGASIDKLFTYKADNWCIIRDFLRSQRTEWKKYNSSVVRFTSGELNQLWLDFTDNQRDIQKRFRGDQDYIWDWAMRNKKAEFFPDQWIRSWKWEVRSSKEWATPIKSPGYRTLKVIENVVPPEDCCIAVFHGDPNPSNCKDPWVVDNWR